MPDELEGWCSTLAAWARDKQEVQEVWIFGSQARGDHCSESDLDVAVIMTAGTKGERLGSWLFLAEEWEIELAGMFPVKIDLDLGDPDISAKVVAPALKKEGRRVFCRAKEEQ